MRLGSAKGTERLFQHLDIPLILCPQDEQGRSTTTDVGCSTDVLKNQLLECACFCGRYYNPRHQGVGLGCNGFGTGFGADDHFLFGLSRVAVKARMACHGIWRASSLLRMGLVSFQLPVALHKLSRYEYWNNSSLRSFENYGSYPGIELTVFVFFIAFAMGPRVGVPGFLLGVCTDGSGYRVSITSKVCMATNFVYICFLCLFLPTWVANTKEILG